MAGPFSPSTLQQTKRINKKGEGERGELLTGSRVILHPMAPTWGERIRGTGQTCAHPSAHGGVGIPVDVVWLIRLALVGAEVERIDVEVAARQISQAIVGPTHAAVDNQRFVRRQHELQKRGTGQL